MKKQKPHFIKIPKLNMTKVKRLVKVMTTEQARLRLTEWANAKTFFDGFQEEDMAVEIYIEAILQTLEPVFFKPVK